MSLERSAFRERSPRDFGLAVVEVPPQSETSIRNVVSDWRNHRTVIMITASLAFCIANGKRGIERGEKLTEHSNANSCFRAPLRVQPPLKNLPLTNFGIRPRPAT